jgi:uncharacterized membrane protein YbhN (UPF0104 family)
MKIDGLKSLFRNKWIRGITQLVIIMSCVWYIYQNLKQVDLQSYTINFLSLVFALAMTILGTTLGATSWWLTLRVFGQKLQYLKVCNIQYRSTLAKYLPGFGWQLVGKSYLTINAGIPASTTGFALIFEYIEIFLTGFCLTVVFFPASIDIPISFLEKISNHIKIIQILSILFLGLTPLWSNLILRVFFKKNGENKVYWIWAMRLISLMLITWMINSYGFHQLFSSIGYVGEIDFKFTVFIFTVTYLIGFLIIIVPGSIGVRVAIFIFLLSPLIGSSLASLMAILYRIITIISELLVYLFLILGQRFLIRQDINNS